MPKERYLVTAALPYANGPLHVGHAVGAYIPADVYSRYLRLKGHDAIYMCGTDEHGTPISVTAETEGITPQQVVDKYYTAISKAFSDLGVSFENFSRTTKKLHYKLSQDFFLKILERGFIYEKTVKRPYCPNCKRFLPDRYVRGVCPKCEAIDQRGDQCEKCGKQLEPHELVQPYCAICGNTPEQRETKHWFFKLSAFGNKLEDWIKGKSVVKMSENLPPNARNFALGWIKEGLQDRAITRDISWGVPVPLEGAEGKVLYVWFDAPIGYISATMEWAEKIGKPDEWKKYWQDKDTKIVHFIGKDNIPFHIVIWPAMLMAQGGYNLPWQVASNEFLNLEGEKMSTSRGWVLWLQDAIDGFGADPLRYYLISTAPESHDSDFSLLELQARVNNELIGTLGNFINRVLSFIQERNGGVIPKPGELDAEDERLIETIRSIPETVGKQIENFKLTAALAALMGVAQQGNIYFQNKQPWKNENNNTLYLSANLVRSLAVAMQPFLPYSAEKVWVMLNLPGNVHKQHWDSSGLLEVMPGHRIGKVNALYAKIEDDKIQEFAEKFLNKKEGSKKAENEVKAMPEIDYEEFKRMDLRVGIIKEARPHPNADKLLVLQVDLGALGTRQLVGGIKNYPMEQLPGKRIIVIANLKPAKIRGVESQGMLLAADENGSPVMLTTDRDAAPGAKIL
jgi:methionyl-tRNA synthetase